MRKVGKKILVLTEGWTEYYYAMGLKSTLSREKQRSVSVDIPLPNNENTFDQLVKKAISRSNEARRSGVPFDAIWLFIDKDSNPLQAGHFTNEQFRLAYCSISIEHWFILHFEDRRAGFSNANGAINHLNRLWQRAFRTDYSKTTQKHFEKLRDLQATAVQRARSIEQQAQRDAMPQHEANPFFTLPDFIAFFQSL